MTKQWATAFISGCFSKNRLPTVRQNKYSHCRNLMLRDVVNFLVVWWPCLPRIHGSFCSKSRSEHKLACFLLCLLCLQRAFGGFDLLLQGWKDFLRKTPRRNIEAQMCSMWWGTCTGIFRKFDSRNSNKSMPKVYWKIRKTSLVVVCLLVYVKWSPLR